MVLVLLMPIATSIFLWAVRGPTSGCNRCGRMQPASGCKGRGQRLGGPLPGIGRRGLGEGLSWLECHFEPMGRAAPCTRSHGSQLWPVGWAVHRVQRGSQKRGLVLRNKRLALRGDHAQRVRAGCVQADRTTLQRVNRKSGNRFCSAANVKSVCTDTTNAKRLRGGHAQTKRLERNPTQPGSNRALGIRLRIADLCRVLARLSEDERTLAKC